MIIFRSSRTVYPNILPLPPPPWTSSVTSVQWKLLKTMQLGTVTKILSTISNLISKHYVFWLKKCSAIALECILVNTRDGGRDPSSWDTAEYFMSWLKTKLKYDVLEVITAVNFRITRLNLLVKKRSYTDGISRLRYEIQIMKELCYQQFACHLTLEW